MEHDEYDESKDKHISWNQFRKECYLLARDERELIADNTFNQKAQCLIDKALKSDNSDDMIALMEGIISHGTEYNIAEYEFAPILVYINDDTGLDTLSTMAHEMADALRRLGETVQTIDLSVTKPQDLHFLMGKTFKAMIGIQTNIFSLHMVDGSYFHDTIDAPKYNFLFDHPASFHKNLIDTPDDYHILTHDRNYVWYICNFFPNMGCTLIPPGGSILNPDTDTKDDDVISSLSMHDKNSVVYTQHDKADSHNVLPGFVPMDKRTYGVSFVGSYYEPELFLTNVKALDERFEGKATKLAELMIAEPSRTYESAVADILGDVPAQTHYDLIDTYFYAMSYYRKKIIRTLLDAGIDLHVFSDCWRVPAWSNYPNLHIHDSVDYLQGLEVYANSRLSLNIMSWHKDGMTERIANIMLNGAVTVTDKSTRLAWYFEEGKDIAFFDLEHIEELPDKINALLADDSLCTAIAQNGQKKALEEHTWDARAKEFMELIE